jgi:hypothetical protein
LIALLPAVVVLAAWRWLAGRGVHVRYLILAFLLPSFAILAWQYLSYFGPEGRSTIFFAPLEVMAYYAEWLLPKFLLSILLPLTVLVAYRRQVLESPTMQLAWLLFAFAAGYSYLLAESNETVAGNFVWSGQIGTYLLFVSSAVFALRHWKGRWRSWLCAGVFCLHSVSGALFFAHPFDWGTRPAIDETWSNTDPLAERVRKALAADPIVGRIPMEIEAKGDAVRLWSDQTIKEERTRAVGIASAVEGVGRVEDRMK